MSYRHSQWLKTHQCVISRFWRSQAPDPCLGPTARRFQRLSVSPGSGPRLPSSKPAARRLLPSLAFCSCRPMSSLNFDLPASLLAGPLRLLDPPEQPWFASPSEILNLNHIARSLLPCKGNTLSQRLGGKGRGHPVMGSAGDAGGTGHGGGGDRCPNS